MEDCYIGTLCVCFTLMTTQKQKKTYGNRVFEKILKECKQLENLIMFGIEDPEKLSIDERQK